MHGRDIDIDVLVRFFQPGAEICLQFGGPERGLPSVVDVYPVRHSCGECVPVERGICTGDDRPRVRVGGRFAGKVSGIELGDGGAKIVQLEYDDRRDLVAGVDFDDAQRIRGELRGPAVADRVAREDEALAAGCDDDERRVRDPDRGGGLHVCDLGIPTAPDPYVYDAPAIVDNDVVGQ